jgi:FkbM family methyltransferase
VNTINPVRLGLTDALIVAAARRSWTLYKYLNSIVRANIANQSIAIPLFDRIGLYHLDLQDEYLRYVALLRRILKQRPGAVIDVGVNIGQFLVLLLLADRSRAWLGFEPLVACCNYVEHLIRANRLTNHRVFPLGLSSRPDVVSFYYANETDVSASAVDGFYADQNKRLQKSIIVDRGDSVLERIGNLEAVSLLKIDTEGAELEVLEGFEQTIQRNRPLLIIEVAPYAHVLEPSVRAVRLERIQRLDRTVRGLGYKLYRIGKGATLESVTGELDPKESTDLVNMDYLCVPLEVNLSLSI